MKNEGKNEMSRIVKCRKKVSHSQRAGRRTYPNGQAKSSSTGLRKEKVKEKVGKKLLYMQMVARTRQLTPPHHPSRPLTTLRLTNLSPPYSRRRENLPIRKEKQNNKSIELNTNDRLIQFS